MKSDSILKIVAYAMVPMIMMFGLYIQFHGEISPGGGFQAGSILASGIILYSWIGQTNVFVRIITLSLLENLSAFGVLLYISVGIFTILKGGNFLDYSLIFVNNPSLGQELGVFFVELGVCITVFSTFLVIYFNLNNLVKNDF